MNEEVVDDGSEQQQFVVTSDQLDDKQSQERLNKSAMDAFNSNKGEDLMRHVSKPSFDSIDIDDEPMTNLASFQNGGTSELRCVNKRTLLDTTSK